jgi:phosphomannomutase/phosphoglucomutase
MSRERGEEIEKLMGNVKNAAWDEVKDVVKYENASQEHVKAMKKLLNGEKIKKAKLKVAIDAANATVNLVAPDLFRELGCEVISLNSSLDGHFPGRESEPTKENVKKLIETVKASKCDFGIAFDGDADRVVLIDEKGEYIVGDRVFALSTLIKLKEKKGSVVSTVATSKAVEDVASKFGAKVLYTKIGAPYLSEVFAKSSAVIGGEEVGGVIWPELSFAKDGIFTAAKIAEAIAVEGKSLGELLKQVPLYYNEKTRIEVNDAQKAKIISSMREYAKGKKLNVIDIDGVRINFDDSWVIIRASGTESYVRVFAESKSAEKAKKLMEEYKKLAEGFRK